MARAEPGEAPKARAIAGEGDMGRHGDLRKGMGDLRKGMGDLRNGMGDLEKGMGDRDVQL